MLEDLLGVAPELVNGDWQYRALDRLGGNTDALCRNVGRAEKERAMLRRQSDRLTEALVKIDAWLGHIPQPGLEGVGRRIGQALGRYPTAADVVHARVLTATASRAVGLQITRDVTMRRKTRGKQGLICCTPTARKPIPLYNGGGTSNWCRRRRRSAPPRAT